MKTHQLQLKITYLQSNRSQVERRPVLACFLDARYDRKPEIVTLGKVGSQHLVTVQGKTNDLSKELDSNTSLCFQSFSWRLNEFGSPCELDNGVNYVTFGEIQSEMKNNGKFEKDLDLVMHTAQGLIKGVIRIEVNDFNYLLKAPMISRAVSTKTNKNAVDTYIQTTMQIETNMPDTLNGTDRMRMPFDFSENGFQMGYALPAIAYVMAETPKSNLRYWENAFQTVMKRNDFHSFESLDLENKARIVILTICYVAQFLDYVGDTVDRNTKGKWMKQLQEAYENFGDAGFTWSGDCEDLACLILQCYWAFVGFDFKGFPTFIEMQKIANAYVAILSLDVVHGAQVSDQVESYGAHMNVNFVPLDLFEKWHDAEIESNAKNYPKSISTKKLIIKGLPFLVGEGTGMYEPLGFDFGPQMEAMRYVYGSARSVEQFKKPILHKRNEPGNFFVASLVGMTDYYYRRGFAKTPLGFWYVTKNKTRGVLYSDMMRNDERNIGIKAHPSIPENVMEVINDTILKRIPPKALALDKSSNHSKTNSVLDHVLGSVKKMDFKTDVSVPIFIRPHQLVKALGDAMVMDFKRMDRVMGLKYELEEITDDIWGYNLSVYFK